MCGLWYHRSRPRGGAGFGWVVVMVSVVVFLNAGSVVGSPIEGQVEDLLAGMSLKERVGQVMMGSFYGPAVSDELEQYLDTIRPGGLILYSVTGNIEDLDQVGELIVGLQEASREASGIPLFVGIDQEGGLVNRLTEGVTVFPGNMALGATRSPKLAAEVAGVVGRELEALGINMNFAPVVDVNSNPANPVIGTRSFGSCPQLVSELGTAMVAPYRAAGVIATAKHFPGHGDTDLDSHFALPVVDHDRDHLEKVELWPFRAMVEEGVPAVMTAHVLVPALEDDPRLPATLSPAILGLLREEHGFEGLIITDSMGMAGITGMWDIEEAAVQALRAGADLLLFGPDGGHTPQKQLAIRDRLLEAIRDGDLDRQRLDEAVRRILRLKYEYGVMEEPQSREGARDVLATSEHLAVAHRVGCKSLTVLGDVEWPLPDEPHGTVPVLWPLEREATLEILLRELSFLEPVLIPIRPGEGDLARVRTATRGADRVLVGSWDLHHNTGWREVVGALDPGQAVILALGSPYDILHAPGQAAYILTYSDQPRQVECLARLLAGKQKPQGRLPVSLAD